MLKILIFFSFFLNKILKTMCLKKKISKRRYSLVRIIASFVPNFLWNYLLPKSQGMLIGMSVVDKMSSIKSNNFNLDDSNSSFYNFKSHFHNLKRQQLLNSTPKKDDAEENEKIKALEKDLEEIKKQVAKLLEHHTEQLQYSDYGSLTTTDQLQKSFIPPPPPPPPPPPLPAIPPTPVNTPLKTEPKVKKIAPPNGFPCGKELLKDLKKVQLRKIEKSPGGGPVKKTKKVVNDPGDFLEAVLKKRFGFIQNSSDSSLESPSVDSFGSATHHSSMEFQKNFTPQVL